MEQYKNEQTETLTQVAEAKESYGEEKGEVSLGKFKDVQALLSAYGSLESEFTKRCQKIKELESALETIKDKDEKAPEKEVESTTEQPKKQISEEERQEILKEYLYSVLGRKQSAIMLDGNGVGVKTQKVRPKTIEEAGKLAKELFIKNKTVSQ